MQFLPGLARQKTVDGLEDQISQLRHELHLEKMRSNGGPTGSPPEYEEVRLGVRYFDPLASQAELRGRVEPTIKIEIYPDKWVFKCRRLLEESEYNQLVGILGFKLDRS